MNLDAIPLFAMLKGRLGYLGDREKLLAQNIANASTPDFAPSDMKPFVFEAALNDQGGGRTGAMASVGGGAVGVGGLAQTQANHLPHSSRRATATAHGKIDKAQSDSETSLDGNAVVLEEQMIKLTESRMDYDAAIGFYQKSLGLLRMAARAPGK